MLIWNVCKAFHIIHVHARIHTHILRARMKIHTNIHKQAQFSYTLMNIILDLCCVSCNHTFCGLAQHAKKKHTLVAAYEGSMRCAREIFMFWLAHSCVLHCHDTYKHILVPLNKKQSYSLTRSHLVCEWLLPPCQYSKKETARQVPRLSAPVHFHEATAAEETKIHQRGSTFVFMKH